MKDTGMKLANMVRFDTGGAAFTFSMLSSMELAGQIVSET
jgi:hypothetical protein